MKTLYVRVGVKHVESFGRAGHRFTRAWVRLTDVDEATARVLEAEQLLEVSEQEPEGFEATAEGLTPLQLAARSDEGLNALERQILGIVETRLDTSTLDDVFDAISEHFALDRRADRAELAALQSAYDLRLGELAEAREKLADTEARLANVLDDHQHLVQAYEALKATVDVPAAVAAAAGVRTDAAIEQMDASLAKLKAAIEPDESLKQKKGGK